MIDEGTERHIIHDGPEPTEIERFNVRRWTTRNGLTILVSLGGIPRHPFRHDEAFTRPEEIVSFYENLVWSRPWGAGPWAGTAIMYQNFNRLPCDPHAKSVMRTGIEWLLKKQDPATGAWSDGSGVSPYQFINGIFKIWLQVIPDTGMTVQYPEQVVDLCILGMREDPALATEADACSFFDVALVLDVALRHTGHRHGEVAELCAAYLPRFEPMIRDDGAFSYCREHSHPNHGGLALAPVKAQSDLAETAVNCNTLALVCNLCGLCDKLGWTPMTKWRMKYPRPCAPDGYGSLPASNSTE